MRRLLDWLFPREFDRRQFLRFIRLPAVIFVAVLTVFVLGVGIYASRPGSADSSLIAAWAQIAAAFAFLGGGIVALAEVAQSFAVLTSSLGLRVLPRGHPMPAVVAVRNTGRGDADNVHGELVLLDTGGREVFAVFSVDTSPVKLRSLGWNRQPDRRSTAAVYRWQLLTPLRAGAEIEVLKVEQLDDAKLLTVTAECANGSGSALRYPIEWHPPTEETPDTPATTYSG